METSLNAEYIYLPNIGTNLKMALYSKICTFTMQNFERYDKINKVAAILVNFRFFFSRIAVHILNGFKMFTHLQSLLLGRPYIL